MPSFDWKQWLDYSRNKARKISLWAWFVAASAGLAAILMLVFVFYAPTYVPLFDGLTAKQGGAVIKQLQKMGVPYRLNSSGSIISVPKDQVGQARLQLGHLGIPENKGSAAWNQLVAGSMTVSQVAQDALSRRALENRLETTLNHIQGVASAKVTLALPKTTPFLQDQPKPKASVWIKVVPPGLNTEGARAIAQLVATSVTGLDVSNVTVTDQSGHVLAPIRNSGLHRASGQLAFTNRVETQAQRRLKALLVPLIGADNVRIAVSADINFDEINQRKVKYGPNSTPKHVKTATQVGPNQKVAQGVPGALSNQPPGKTSAPVTIPQSGQSGTNQTQDNTQRSKKKNSHQTSPTHRSRKKDIQYQVDHTTTTRKAAPWRINGLSASVVINQGAVDNPQVWVNKVKAIVHNALNAPNVNVNVALVPFHIQQTTSLPQPFNWRAYVSNPTLMRALMALLAALLVLFGIAKPLARWLRNNRPVPPYRPVTPEGPRSQPYSPPPKQPTTHVDHAQGVARSRPEESAEMVRRWLRSETTNDNGPAHNENKGARGDESS